jgi:acyl-CoA synthetase (AMP-forming)/AMP-acid ligase II
VHALVVTTADSVLTAEEVIEHCRNRMSSYKKPSSVEFVEALPTNAYGKVLKRDLRARHGVNRTNIGT